MFVSHCVIMLSIALVIGQGDIAKSDDAQPISGPATVQPTSMPTTVPARPTACEMPVVDEVDLAFLVQNARSAFRAIVTNSPEKSAAYKPTSLKDVRGTIYLTLREYGSIRAESASDGMDIVEASIAAGTLLGRAAMDKKLKLDMGGDELGIEFEWLGAREYLTIPYFEKGEVWSDELLHSFEPAVEGIGVEFREKRGQMRPSFVVTRGFTPDLMLAGAENAVELRSIHKMRFSKEIRYFRFGSYLLWQPRAKDRPIVLHRGDSLVPPDAVSREGLDAAIGRVGAYLIFRQNSNGEFSDTYLPASGTYGQGNSARVQLRALHGMAAYANWTRESEPAARLERGIAAFSKYLEPMVMAGLESEGEPEAKEVGRVLAPAGHTGHLEITGRLLACMLGSPDAKQYEKDTTGMIDALLASQLEDGLIAMSVEGPDQTGSVKPSLADGARALHVLAQVSMLLNDPRVTAAVERGFQHFRSRTVVSIEPDAGAALLQALCLHYVKTNDARVSDMAFELADRFVLLQIGGDDRRQPEMAGAINAYKLGEVGIDTAVYLAALCDAARLAERVGDAERSDRYRAAVRAAARFVMQLEFREAGCFFVNLKREALGGVRAALWDGRLRVDHTAAALKGLIEARRLLYGEPKR